MNCDVKIRCGDQVEVVPWSGRRPVVGRYTDYRGRRCFVIGYSYPLKNRNPELTGRSWIV